MDRDGFFEKRPCTRAYCLNDEGYRIQETLFTFRSRNEFVDFSESG